MIAIKGLEMPKSCADCPMSYLSGWEIIYCHCVLGVYGINDIDWAHERHKDCPLVECIGIIRGYKENKPKLFGFDEEVEDEI